MPRCYRFISLALTELTELKPATSTRPTCNTFAWVESSTAATHLSPLLAPSFRPSTCLTHLTARPAGQLLRREVGGFKLFRYEAAGERGGPQCQGRTERVTVFDSVVLVLDWVLGLEEHSALELTPPGNAPGPTPGQSWREGTASSSARRVTERLWTLDFWIGSQTTGLTGRVEGV